VISNLQYTPQSAQAGSGTINVTGRIDFTTDLDVVTLMLTDSRGGNHTIPISASAGIKVGFLSVPENSLSIDPAGLYVFTVWVVDDAGNSSNTLTGTIDVYLAADAGISRSVTTGSAVSLNGSGSSNVNNLAYDWIFRRKPANSVTAFNDKAAVDPIFIPDVDGVYEVQLTVNDGLTYSDPEMIFITAIPTGFVTIGSHKNDVAAIQGTPTEINSLFNRWYYGLLNYFNFSSNNTITEWNNYDGSLKVIMVPGNNATNSAFIMLGSHKDDVIAVQGTPTKIDTLFNRWYYGPLTYIVFSGDTVTAWNNYDGSLIVE
jgi:hypothetical protein